MARNISADGEVVTIRLPRELLDQVRHLEARQFESRSVIIRRLLRVALSTEPGTLEPVSTPVEMS